MKQAFLFFILLVSIFASAGPPSERGSYYKVFKTKDRDDISRHWAEEVSLYDIRNGMRVMDVGGSDGKMILPLSLICDTIDYCVEDIDPQNFAWTEPFMALARKNINPQAHFGLSQVQGGDSTIPAGGTYDRILVRETVHHFKYPMQMLSEFRRLLAADGHIIVSEPTDQRKFKHCKLIATPQLQAMFVSAGFKLVSQSVTRGGFVVYIFAL
jgi:2-polyprenyl-3-methyl-5-hydroxy-6-metoxy-1,4-benzoquinol methylase